LAGWTWLTNGKEAQTLLLNYARACLTATDTAGVHSLTALEELQPVDLHGDLVTWVAKNMLSKLKPLNKAPRATTPTTVAANAAILGASSPDVVMAILPLVECLATIQEQNTVLQLNYQTEREEAARRAAEKAARAADKSVDAMPDVVLSNRLGFARLPWSERHHLNPVFAQMYITKNKKEQYAILKAFFNDLAELDPSFHGFVNSKVFQDMSDLNFIPGNDAAMAHHGLGILAFSIVNYKDMQYDEDEQDTLARATTVTTEDIRKSKTSKSVAPPANMDGLLHLLNHYRIFTNALWTRDSKWARHVSALHCELNESQHQVGNDPEALL
jgi:hypothetical protein